MTVSGTTDRASKTFLTAHFERTSYEDKGEQVKLRKRSRESEWSLDTAGRGRTASSHVKIGWSNRTYNRLLPLSVILRNDNVLSLMASFPT